MYSKQFDLFGSVTYYRNGEQIGFRRFGGELQLDPFYRYRLRGGGHPVELTRAQAYRYWSKHFPDEYFFNLPQALQEGLDRKPQSYGYYINRHGEMVGYEG